MLTFKATIHAPDKDYTYIIKAKSPRSAFAQAKKIGKAKHKHPVYGLLYTMKVKTGKIFRKVR